MSVNTNSMDGDIVQGIIAAIVFILLAVFVKYDDSDYGGEL